MSKCKFQGERIGYIHVRCASKDAADAVLLVSMMMLSLLSLKCLACISKPASRVPCLQWCFNCFRVSTPEIEVVADEDHRASGKALEHCIEHCIFWLIILDRIWYNFNLTECNHFSSTCSCISLSHLLAFIACHHTCGLWSGLFEPSQAWCFHCEQGLLWILLCTLDIIGHRHWVQVLTTPALKEMWLKELTFMSNRINDMRVSWHRPMGFEQCRHWS